MKSLKVVLNRNVYIVIWDEENILDTIQREKDGKFLSYKNADCKRIINNESKLFRGVLPDGFSKAN